MAKSPDAFVYNATLDRIVDGDTFDCILDFGVLGWNGIRFSQEEQKKYKDILDLIERRSKVSGKNVEEWDRK